MAKTYKKYTTPRTYKSGVSISDFNSVSNLGEYTPSIEVDSDGSGGGGSGTSNVSEYSATNGSRVIASDAGVTFSKSSGTGTFVIPEGVILLSATINGATADLDGSNNFKTVFNYTGASNNTDITNFNPPNIQVLNTTAAAINGDDPSDSFAVVYDEGASPQRQVVLLGSGDITTRVIGLDVYTNWTLKFNF